MWSRRRGAGLHRPQPLSRRVGTFPNPPSLRCRLGQVCACELVSAICRVHLSTPGSHCSLRLDLAPAFVELGEGAGWERVEATGEQMEPSVKWRSYR